MRTTNSSLAVFVWTFRRKWKGFVIFIAATAVMVFIVFSIYPEISELRGKAVAEALGGDVEVSLTQNSKAGGDYTLSWSEYGGADGYVVVESDTEIPLSLIKGMGVSGVNLRLLARFLPNLPGDGKITIHTFDAASTTTDLTGLDETYGKENALVYFGVLAFRGKASNASIEGASQSVNTRNLVAKGPFEKLMENPLIKAFVGSESVDIFSIKGFLCVELFSGLTLYIMIYFLIQYAGAFCCEMENKTIDVILSTPLSRRRLFISRYLSWVAMNLILIVSWIVFIYIGVRALGEEAEVSLADVARTMILFLPLILSVQGFCMLASVVTNESRKAYGISFGIYFGMHFLEMVGILSERLSFLKYLAVFHYWDYNVIFIDGIVPWGSIVLLTLVSIGLFIAGLVVFERRDLAS